MVLGWLLRARLASGGAAEWVFETRVALDELDEELDEVLDAEEVADGVDAEVEVTVTGTPEPGFGYEIPIAPPTTMTTSVKRTKAVFPIACLFTLRNKMLLQRKGRLLLNNYQTR